MWETVTTGVLEFGDEFHALTGMGWWVPTIIVLGFCGAYRLVLALTQGKREALRRKFLLRSLRGFIDRSVTANDERRIALENDRARAQAAHYTNSQPVDRLLEATGIGERSIEALINANLLTLGHIRLENMGAVFRIGPIKVEAAMQFIYALESWAGQQLLDRTGTVKSDPAVDRLYDEAAAELDAQQQLLDEDHRALQPVDAELDRYETEACGRSTSDLLRDWVQSPLRSLRRSPGRVASLGALFTLFLSILCALPLIALAWDPRLLPDLIALSTAGVWIGSLIFLTVYFVLAEMAIAVRSRKPDPYHFYEQRLQFWAMQMALAKGIAPPTVRVDDDPGINAFAVGRSRGPSLIVVNAGLIDGMTPAAVKAVLGHEMGHLAGDHIRLGVTSRYLTAPFQWVGRRAILAAGWLWFRTRNYVTDFSGETVFYKEWRWASPAWFLLFVPVSLVALVTTVLRFAFEAIGSALSRQDEYDADRAAAELTSTENASFMLQELVQLTSGGPSAQHHQEMLRRILGATPQQLPPHTKWMHVVEQLAQRLGGTHPRTDRRVDALVTPTTALGDSIAGAMRAVAVIGAAAVTLALLTSAARASVTWTSDLFSSPPPPPIAAPAPLPTPRPPPAQPEVREDRVIRIHHRLCNIREQPNHSARIVGGVRNGQHCVFVGHEENRYVQVECPEHTGWVHDSCLAH